MSSKGLLERLKNGGSVMAAEGYLFEFERRGYLQAGAFVPEVVTEHPDLVRTLHEEFVHAGSDVVLAFTYYGHRRKLRVIGKEDQLEPLNRTALRIARQVADKTGTLMAGNICNTSVYERGNQNAIDEAAAMFKEQVEWAVEEGADFIVGETFMEFGEAKLALDAILQHGKGKPAVIMLEPRAGPNTFDGIPYPQACRKLEEAGAAVVGLNCCRGPETILPTLKEIKKVCKGPIAVLPVPFRTHKDCPTMQSLKDKLTGQQAFYANLQGHLVSNSEVQKFAEDCRELGVQYIGLCCGNSAAFTRTIAEAYGRRPPASKYTTDMSKHFVFGSSENKLFSKYYQEGGKKAFMEPYNQ